MDNKDIAIRICEKKEGRTWIETYRNEDPENVYEFLAKALRTKYIWKGNAYGKITERSIGDGTYRELTIYERNAAGQYAYRTRYIVKG